MTSLHVIDSVPAGRDVCDFLECALKRARDGEFSAVAFAFVRRDGATGSGYSSQPSTGTMVGAVEALKAKPVRDMIGD